MRVFASERFTGQLEVAAVAGQQQDTAELFIVDERAAVAADRGMELVPRGVFGIAVEQVPGNQSGLANAIKKLIAALHLVVRTAPLDVARGCPEQGRRAGEADEAGGGGEESGEEESASHLQSIPPSAKG